MIEHLVHKFRSYRDDLSGAAMVEFAISLPILLLIFAIVVEGSRITWIHQAAASGVRDAARYLARTSAPNICEVASNVTAFNANTDIQDTAETIVVRRVGNPNQVVLPGSVDLVSVTPEMDCVTVDYQAAQVPVVEVRVRLEIEFPFAGAFELFGERLDPLVTEITDESRVFGT